MKYTRHPHNQVIQRKLEQLPSVDADSLWSEMHSILDKKMPQKKDRRRFIAWLLTGKGLFLLSIASMIMVTGLIVFYLPKNETPGTTDNLPNSDEAATAKKNGATLVSSDRKESITTTDENQIKDISEGTMATSASTIDRSKIENKNSLTQSKKDNWTYFYTLENESNDQTQADYFNTTNSGIQAGNHASITLLNDRRNETVFDITNVNLKSTPANSVMGFNNGPTPNSANNGNRLREKGLYAGITIGADLSSIHFQSVKTGATKGLLVGYAFNERWSVESGVLWDKKRFFDDGSYFNPQGYTPTAGIEIVAVNGTNRIYEWPINVKFAVLPGKHSLFVTTGLSSYFMKRENYDYEYTQNNQPGGHNYLSYENETKDWFSVANFSLGYAYKLSGGAAIRIEPYLKLPLKNLGTGNMPVMSTGLNIGFTKNLTR